MDTAVTVSELLPPLGSRCLVTDAMIERHEAAVEVIICGQWILAQEILKGLPPSGPKQFLLDHMAEFGNRPPADWNGSFPLAQK